MTYEKGDVVFIDYRDYYNYVRVLDSTPNDCYNVEQLNKPVGMYSSKLKFTSYCLFSSNSRLCCNLERLLIGELG